MLAIKERDFFERLYGPVSDFAKSMFDKSIELVRSATDTTITIKEQCEAVTAIIKAVREEGVKSVEITMDVDAGAELGAKFDKDVDVKIFKVGKTGAMTMKVEYK
ncbi:hypothetical protein QZM22_23760 [Burkholderia oklahomensis]|uniref:Uncharacterized protein n=1 Tax=Burkholderia anthina TaxID=179879 RepID=A0AAW3PTK2_9BURK|nr:MULTISPECIES: hypothetical protein [Burkholderia]KWZ31658.1 hypothetical protein WS64_25700 [Burkholderia anthina]MDN7675443.1 hypothetical protein [Burkholderia oklahomensis]